MSKVYNGGCLCGSIRFTANSPNNSHTCSCDICQKHTGAPTVIWIEFDAKNVECLLEIVRQIPSADLSR